MRSLVWVRGGCGGTYAPRPLVPDDRTLPVLIASSGECQERTSRPTLKRRGRCLLASAIQNGRAPGGVCQD